MENETNLVAKPTGETENEVRKAKLPYSEFLQSEEWKVLRWTRIRISKGKCEACGHYNLGNHAHHLFYRKTHEQTEIDDLRLLCQPCHQSWHDRYGKGHRNEKLALEHWKQFQKIKKNKLLKQTKKVEKRRNKKRPKKKYNSYRFFKPKFIDYTEEMRQKVLSRKLPGTC